MGNAAIYYYPAGLSRETIDIGEGLGDAMQLTPEHRTTGARTLTGQWFRVDYGETHRWRFLVERIQAGAVERSLRSLQRHLRRGGVCGVTHDTDKGWGGFATTPPQRGDTSITIGGQAFYNLLPSLASGAEVVIQSFPPESNFEILTISAASTTTLTLSESVRYTYTGPVLVRWRHFWPLLALPADELGASSMTDEHGQVHTWMPTLEDDVPGLLAMASQPAGILAGAVAKDGQDSTESVRILGTVVPEFTYPRYTWRR